LARLLLLRFHCLNCAKQCVQARAGVPRGL
jgi:hypothetical protein